MKVHVLKHVPFEGPGTIADWAGQNQHSIVTSNVYAGDAFPALKDFDFLVVMGGPMGVDDESKHPWLRQEKVFIREAINAKKKILGICLGAQLLAVSLGAKVHPGAAREIGWFPVKKGAKTPSAPLLDSLPETLTPLHWHSDVFDCPTGAIPLYESDRCKQQAFLYQDHILVFQFHLESTHESHANLLKHCGEEAGEKALHEMREVGDKYYEACRVHLFKILDLFTSY